MPRRVLRRARPACAPLSASIGTASTRACSTATCMSRRLDSGCGKGDPMAKSVRPFLMFEGNAEAAMNFYVSLFPGAEIASITRFGAEGPGAAGSVYQASFSVAGQTVMCFDSPVKHGFTFTPSISLFVECESDAEIERLAGALGEGGQFMMPLGD